MLNEHLVKAGNYEEVWVMPIYLKPGKNDSFIRGSEDAKVMRKIGEVGRDRVKLLPYQYKDDC